MTTKSLLTSALLACGLILSLGAVTTLAAGPGQRPMPVVSVIEVAAQPLTLTTELSGRTAPYLVAEVRPQVGGILQQRLFTEGSEVKQGELLYQIDPATFQAAYASANAVLARAEANLVPTRNKAERYRELVEVKAVSQQEYDDAVAAKLLAEADLAAARAALESARIHLAYTGVKAPISGNIGRSSMTTGALVTANQAQALATIQQLDPIYVDVTQSSSDLLQLKRGIASGVLKGAGDGAATVTLQLEDGTPYPLEGTMKFSEVTVDQTTGSVTLRCLFPNPDGLLLPGMFVRTRIAAGSNDQAILIPQRAVTRDQAGKALVMVVDNEEKVAARPIDVLRTVGDNWLVSSGLAIGDRVIMEGTQKARPGTAVKVIPFAAEAQASNN